MKRDIILIRHTKSSWGDISQPDFERPLKKERVEDASNMARRLKELGLRPDLIICSPAVRTRQTAEYFCIQLNFDFRSIQFEKKIYDATFHEVLEVIRSVDGGIRTLVLIGHNPSLTDFAHVFIPGKIHELPTTGVVWLEFEKKNWEIDRSTRCSLKYYLTPKTIS